MVAFLVFMVGLSYYIIVCSTCLIWLCVRWGWACCWILCCICLGVLAYGCLVYIVSVNFWG